MSMKLDYKASAFAIIAVLALGACEPEEDVAPTPTPTTDMSAAPEIAPSPTPVTAEAAMQAALAGDWRVAPERDAFRHPAETLAFFGVEPDMTVVEIWPGGGWYSSVLGPYLKQGGGTLVAAGPDPAASDYAANSVQKFTETFIAHPETYGDINMSIAAKTSESLAPPESADVVLTFRNIHNWMKGEYADKMFKDAYAALKPGGILGVVEHRLPSAEEQDPQANSGYVQEAYVIKLAEEAGFEFVESSEINANPADTADHPFGVWTLPPVSRSAPREGEAPEGFDPSVYAAIGESDRMTLKFVKPLPAETVETDTTQ
ncbi:MAG: hypothetical protein CME88_17635 [Hirschia sp.]|nr:hypothetical protein [Hirschia sp.]MBF19060.1 hypothetical protein [Hirschia sp.]MBF20194.1 hypothetical protein [Hirschia sp.]|tara:strand:- start:110 stop:1060 length:951 start_codon:yes stop_codon:yes gene_type:complete